MTNKVNRYIRYAVEYIPYRMQILLTALYIWTWVLFRFNKLIGHILGLIIKHTPEYLLLDVQPDNIKVLRAFTKEKTDITKRLKMFLRYKWDHSMCDNNGGFDIDEFSKYIGSSIIYICYIFDTQIDPNLVSRFESILDCIDYNNNNRNNHDKNYINIVMIDITKRVINKLKNNRLTKENILFGEIDLF